MLELRIGCAGLDRDVRTGCLPKMILFIYVVRS